MSGDQSFKGSDWCKQTKNDISTCEGRETVPTGAKKPAVLPPKNEWSSPKYELEGNLNGSPGAPFLSENTEQNGISQGQRTVWLIAQRALTFYL